MKQSDAVRGRERGRSGAAAVAHGTAQGAAYACLPHLGKNGCGIPASLELGSKKAAAGRSRRPAKQMSSNQPGQEQERN